MYCKRNGKKKKKKTLTDHIYPFPIVSNIVSCRREESNQSHMWRTLVQEVVEGQRAKRCTCVPDAKQHIY